MDRTEKFLKNTITTALLQIVTMAAGFILPKVMLSVYGSEINGLVTSITQFISYLTLVEAGLSGATVYSLYKPLAEGDTNRINRVIVAAKNFYYKTGFLFLGLICGGAFLYPLFVKTELLSGLEIGILFVVLGANGILEFFTLAKYRALLTADQKTYVISLASIMQVVLNCAIIWILSYLGVSIVVVRAVAIISILLRTLVLWAYCKKKYKYLDFSVEPDNSALEKRWDALYLQILSVIHTGAPVVIATFMLSLNDVSVYSIYHVVVNGINSILSIFISGLSAGFGDLIVRNEQAKFKKAFQQFEYMYLMLITVVYSIMMATYIPFIRIYTAKADINYIYPVFAILLTVNGFFYNLKTPYGMLVIAAGKYRETRVQTTIQGLLEVVLAVIFSIFWGLNGIIIGALISNIYRDIDFIFFSPKQLLNYSFKDSLIIWGRSIFLFTALSLGTAFIPNTFVTNYLTWILFAIIIAVIVLIVVLSVNILCDREKFKETFIRIKGLLKKVTRGS